MIGFNKLSFGLLDDTKKQATAFKMADFKQYSKLDLKELIQVDFPDNQYYRKETNKTQVCLHHTVSGVGVNGDISHWLSTPDRIATAMIVGRDGKIYQCFSTKYWAHHLGTKAANNQKLNENSIGIEIDSWGGLVKHTDGKYYPALWNKEKKKFTPYLKAGVVENVVLYPKGYRGFYAFEKYTDEQIEAVRKLLVFWNEKFGIPLNYNEDMWDLSNKAMSGTPGIWSHVSYRKDKSDCHPDVDLIKMLKSLS
jgi:N-acetyl-anhydromuramyl-L-alanine amidase AmpD